MSANPFEEILDKVEIPPEDAGLLLMILDASYKRGVHLRLKNALHHLEQFKAQQEREKREKSQRLISSKKGPQISNFGNLSREQRRALERANKKKGKKRR